MSKDAGRIMSLAGIGRALRSLWHAGAYNRVFQPPSATVRIHDAQGSQVGLAHQDLRRLRPLVHVAEEVGARLGECPLLLATVQR